MQPDIESFTFEYLKRGRDPVPALLACRAMGLTHAKIDESVLQ